MSYVHMSKHAAMFLVYLNRERLYMVLVFHRDLVVRVLTSALWQPDWELGQLWLPRLPLHVNNYRLVVIVPLLNNS